MFKEKCFSGHLINSEQLMLSSSGGLVYAISESYIASNGIVYGVTYNDDYTGVSWVRATSLNELKDIQGTKYVKSAPKMKNTNRSVYDCVLEDLNSGYKVLFCGLPCEVGGLRLKTKGMTTEYNLLCIDLICQGPGQTKIYRDFIEYLQLKHKSKIATLSMRYKNPDWAHPYMRIEFLNGDIYQEPLQDTMFWSGIVNIPMKSCTACKFKGKGHVSDITCGDYWGANVLSPTYDVKGTSIAITHTESGENIVRNLNNVVVQEIPIEEALKKNPRYYSSVEVDEYKLRYQKLYGKKGLEYAHKHRLTFKQKLKALIPRFVIKLIDK